MNALTTSAINSVLRSWQTTLAGIAAGLGTVEVAGWTKTDGTPNYWAIVAGVGLAVFGAVAKQHNVTGGTVASTQEASARVEAAPQPKEEP